MSPLAEESMRARKLKRLQTFKILEKLKAMSQFYSSSLLNSTASSESTNSNNPTDLIHFLELIQQYKIDLLPLRWQSALGSLGDGATSHVAESPLNIRTSLAYKRAFHSGGQEQDTDTDYEIFRVLAVELSVLAYPPIRNNPGFVRLEGISWEILPDNRAALPVFVFEKAPHKNLQSFISSDYGKALNIRDRLKLCIQIADALTILHSYLIIHGDVKPKNILLYEEDNTLLAKVADFGFSTLVSSDGMANLACSVPWYAPEYHPRKFTFLAAQKADMFSFGMLCLWLLFKNDLLEMSKELLLWPETEEISLLSVTMPKEHEMMEHLKSKKELISSAHHFLELNAVLNDSEKINLKKFFSLTLANDPNMRALNFLQLLPLLTQTPVLYVGDNSTNDVNNGLAVAEFRLTKHLYALYEEDYRVWTHIIRCLKKRAENSPKDASAQNAAFQLAFCYSIGFGVRRDDQKVQLWLNQSQRNGDDLEVEKRALDHTVTNTGINSAKIRSWNKNGYFTAPNHIPEYQKTRSLESISADYINIIRDLEEGLGQHHFLPLTQKEVLCKIFQAQGKYLQAEILFVQIMTQIETHPGIMPGSSWGASIAVQLAQVLRTQGKVNDAEAWIRVGFENYEEDESGVGQLLCRTLLGSILCDQGRYEMAKAEILQALDGFQRIFGEKHNTTLTTMTHLGGVYLRLGQHEEFLKIGRRIFELGKMTQEVESEKMIGISSNLAVALRQEKKFLEAKQVTEQALLLSKEFLGDNHALTINLLGLLGSDLFHLGDFVTSENHLRQAITGHTELFGENNSWTLRDVASLAGLLMEQKKFETAEKLFRRVLKGRKEIHGENHYLTLVALFDLSSCFYGQGKYSEAEPLCQQALEGHKQIFGINHKKTMGVHALLTQIHNQQWNYESVVRMYQASYARAQSVLGIDHLETANYAVLLSGAKSRLALKSKAKELGIWPSSLDNDDDFDELAKRLKLVDTAIQDLQNRGEDYKAEDMLLATLLVRGNVYGMGSRDVMMNSRKIGLLYLKVHKYPFAQNYNRTALGLGKMLLNERHPETLALMHSVAYVHQVFGEYREAKRFYSQAMQGRRQVLGMEDKMTMETVDSLVMVLIPLGQLADAEEWAAWNLKAREKINGKDHEDTLASINTLTSVLRAQGKYDQAEELNRRALETDMKKLGAQHRITLKASINRVDNLACRKEYQAAEELNRQVFQDMERVFGEYAPDTLESLATLGKMLYRQGKFAEAEDRYQQLAKASQWSLSTNDPMRTGRQQVLQRIQERAADPWDHLSKGKDGETSEDN
ncbi:MAG: hypothetical protein Q9187_002827 [Circinaria calcarea]